MRKQVIIFGIIVAALAYALLTPDPINSLLGFIIGGKLPGTSVMLGFWPMIVVLIFAIRWLFLYLSNIRLDFLANKARTIREEKARIGDQSIKKLESNIAVISAQTVPTA